MCFDQGFDKRLQGFELIAENCNFILELVVLACQLIQLCFSLRIMGFHKLLQGFQLIAEHRNFRLNGISQKFQAILYVAFANLALRIGRGCVCGGVVVIAQVAVEGAFTGAPSCLTFLRGVALSLAEGQRLFILTDFCPLISYISVVDFSRYG